VLQYVAVVLQLCCSVLQWFLPPECETVAVVLQYVAACCSCVAVVLLCAAMFLGLECETVAVVLQYVALCCSCVAVLLQLCCGVLQCVLTPECETVAVVLQYVAVCCSVLQLFGSCIVVCCSALQCVAVRCSVLQRVAACCSVVQCGAVYCSLLQCAAVRCSVLQLCFSVLQWPHSRQLPDLFCKRDPNYFIFAKSLANINLIIDVFSWTEKHVVHFWYMNILVFFKNACTDWRDVFLCVYIYMAACMYLYTNMRIYLYV